MLFIINQWAKPIAVYFTIKKEPIKSLSKIPISPTLGFSKLPLTALFKNTWILKFKSQLMFAFFTAVNHLSGSLSNKKFVIGGFDLLYVSLHSFFACDRNYVDGSQKRNCEDSFWTSVFGCFWKARAVHVHVLTWISMVLITKLDLVFKSGTLLYFSWRIVVVY